MTICSPEAGNIARGRAILPVEGEQIVRLPSICSPEEGYIARGRAILPVEGEQIVMLPSYKGNTCFIMPMNICLQCKEH